MLAYLLWFFLFVEVLFLLSYLAIRKRARRVDGRLFLNDPPTEEQILGSFTPYPKLAGFLHQVRQSSTLAELQSLRAEIVADCKGWKKETPFGKQVSNLFAYIAIKGETIRLQARVNTAASREELHVLWREIDDLARKRGWAYHSIVGEQVRQLVTCVRERLDNEGSGNSS